MTRRFGWFLRQGVLQSEEPQRAHEEPRRAGEESCGSETERGRGAAGGVGQAQASAGGEVPGRHR